MKDESPTGISAGTMRGGASGTHRARVPDVRMALSIIGLEIGVADPHEAVFFVFLRVRLQLFAETLHHAGQIGSAIAVSSNAERTLVIAPQVLGRLGEKSVNVGGHLEVGEGAANFQNVPPLLLERKRGHVLEICGT